MINTSQAADPQLAIEVQNLPERGEMVSRHAMVSC
jgi:hypothetical protein